ncbi:MAG: LytTR family transcriptional regulator [Alistipes sp.]|nr:LytTR family transcriptional regulator [Alistipes sp.]
MLFTIFYWAVCLVVLAVILSSLGYDFFASMFVGSMFLPGLLMIKYFVPQISFRSLAQGLLNAFWLAAAVLVLTYLLLFVVNYYLEVGLFGNMNFPPLLSNPIFILFVLAALALPEHLLDNYLKAREAARPQTVEFISERRHVTLSTEEICYIESLDNEVVVHTISGEELRTRTPISRWEATLNELHFVRIHRAYIVQRNLLLRISRTEVELKEVTLPVSRKYAERLNSL